MNIFSLVIPSASVLVQAVSYKNFDYVTQTLCHQYMATQVGPKIAHRSMQF
jgi:hypothetical protein